MKNKKNYVVVLVSALALVVVSAASAFAANVDAPRLTSEERIAHHEEVLQAVLDGNYDEWYELVSENGMNPEVLEVVTKDNFAEFSRAHKLMEESKEIMEGLGLEGKMGMRMGGGKPFGHHGGK